MFITHSVCQKNDVIKFNDAFSGSVGMFYMNLYSVDQYLKFKLIIMLCMSFNDSELSLDNLGSVRFFKN